MDKGFDDQITVDGRTGVLVVGGYGHVGSRIAERLLRAGGLSVRIAGRDGVKAGAVAAKLGCEAVRLDLADAGTWAAALDGIGIVVVCVDQAGTGFVEFVLRQGLHYVDITADDTFFRKVERLDAVAREAGGGAILSVGLAPGLTNLMVKACAEGMDEVTEARIGVLLGLGDAHGPAAIEWTLRNFENATTRVEEVPFGAMARTHPALPFDFADQHVLQRTLGIDRARTLMTFDTALMSRMMFALLPKIVSVPWLRKLVVATMPYLRLGSDRVALSVQVRGMREGRNVSATLMLEGRKEAEITALVAAETVLHVARGVRSPGIFHIEQVLTIDQLFQVLEREGSRIFSPS